MIVFNHAEFSEIHQDFVYDNKVIIKSIMFGYIPMLEFSFSLN